MVQQLNRQLDTGVSSSAQYNENLFQMGARLRSLAIPALAAFGALNLLSGAGSAGAGAIEGITAAEAKWADQTFQVSTRLQELRNRLLELADPALDLFFDLDEATNGWLSTLTLAAGAALVLSSRLRGIAASGITRAATAVARPVAPVVASGARSALNRPVATLPVATPRVVPSPRGAVPAATQAATRVPGFAPPARPGIGSSIATGAGRAAGVAGFAVPFVVEALIQDDPEFATVLKEGLRSIFDPFGSFTTSQGYPGRLYLDPPAAPDTGFRPTPSGRAAGGNVSINIYTTGQTDQLRDTIRNMIAQGDFDGLT